MKLLLRNAKRSKDRNHSWIHGPDYGEGRGILDPAKRALSSMVLTMVVDST